VSAYSDRVIADGAVGYWRLNETSGTTANDSVGTQHATISGGVTLGVPGLGGALALQYNSGLTGQVLTANISPTTGAIFTVEVWGRLTPGANNNAIINRSGYFQWFWTGVGASIQFDTANWPVVLSGTWAHYVVVVNNTTVNLYVDGVVVSPPQTITAKGVTGVPLNIGSFGNSQSWFGTLQDAALYHRALTPAEITAHYTLGTTVASGSRPLSLGYWKKVWSAA
jgi:hypothetical protein